MLGLTSTQRSHLMSAAKNQIRSEQLASLREAYATAPKAAADSLRALMLAGPEASGMLTDVDHNELMGTLNTQLNRLIAMDKANAAAVSSRATIEDFILSDVGPTEMGSLSARLVSSSSDVRDAYDSFYDQLAQQPGEILYSQDGVNSMTRAAWWNRGEVAGTVRTPRGPQ